MKTASVQTAAVYINCPHCNESFEATDDGSMLVSMHNFSPDRIGQTVQCWACHQAYRLPKRASVVFA